MNKPAVSVLLLTALLHSSGKTDSQETGALEGLIDTSNHKLAVDLFQIFLPTSENFAISPFLSQVSLAVAGEGSKGTTQNEIYKVLHQPDVDKEAMRHAYQDKMLSLHKEVENLRLSIRVFIEKVGEVNTDYYFTTHKYYWTDIVRVDFRIPKKSTSDINQWVSSATGNGIDVLFEPDSLPSGTQLIIASAMYFKDTWKNEFPFGRENENFYARRGGNNTTIEKVRMIWLLNTSLRNKMSYKLGAQILELPYQNSKCKMIILLPTTFDGLDDLLSKMSASNLFAEIDSLGTSNIDVYIPMFNLKTSVALDKAFASFGMPTSFSGKADFTGITSTPIEMSKFIQKTVIEVNQEGTSAGIVAKEAGDEDEELTIFRADHPFAFILLHERTILLQGIITHF